MYYSCNMSALSVGKKNKPSKIWRYEPTLSMVPLARVQFIEHMCGEPFAQPWNYFKGFIWVISSEKDKQNWFPCTSTLYPSFLRGTVKKTCMYTTSTFANFDLTCQRLDKSVLATPSQWKGEKFSQITRFIAFHEHWDNFGCFRNICGPF